MKRHSFPEVQPPPIRRAKAVLKSVIELHRSLARSSFSTSIDGPSEDLVIALARLDMTLQGLLEYPQLESFVRNDSLTADLSRVQQAVVAAEGCFTDPVQLRQSNEVAQNCAELQLIVSELESVHLLLQSHFLYTAVLRTGGELTFGRDTTRIERKAKEQQVLNADLERGRYFATLVSLRDALFSEVTADGMNAYLTHVSELVQDKRFQEYQARLNAPDFFEHLRQKREELEPELEVAGLMGEIR